MIILDTDHNVLFSNTAARKVDSTYQSNNSISIEHGNAPFFDNRNHRLEVFASICPNLFKDTIADSAKTVQVLEALKEYKSLSQILQAEAEQDYLCNKKTYKLKMQLTH